MHSPTINQQIQQFKADCLNSGRKFTAPREAVLRCLLSVNSPMTAYEVLDAVQQDLPGAKPSTIYRSLGFLVEIKMVHRIEAIKSYILCCANHPHDHPQFVICDSCKSVKELPFERNSMIKINEMIDHAGFSKQTPTIEIHGVCKKCAGEY